MGETIFSKILRGDLTCHRLYEDDRVLAFLDIAPLSEGHTLVIPKEEAVTVDRLSDESAAAIGRVLPRIARAVMKATGAEGYNILQNNGSAAHQAVMHVHFHIIPRFPDRSEGPGLGLVWNAGRLSSDQGRELAARIVSQLEA